MRSLRSTATLDIDSLPTLLDVSCVQYSRVSTLYTSVSVFGVDSEAMTARYRGQILMDVLSFHCPTDTTTKRHSQQSIVYVIFLKSTKIDNLVPQFNCCLPSFPDRPMTGFDSTDNPSSSVTQFMNKSVTQSI